MEECRGAASVTALGDLGALGHSQEKLRRMIK